MLTVKNWLDAGYKRYNERTYNLSDYLLSKRIEDKTGKKYHIHAWVYEHFNKDYYKRNPALPEVSFSPEVQFQLEGKPTVDISLIMNKDTTIQEIEQQFECFWLFLERPYYEKWDY